ncbi:MAG: radical SAM protein [Azospirillaceae bacterium]
MVSDRLFQWSRYTRAVRDGDGSVLLHNSFMGAVARVPPETAAAYSGLLEEAMPKNREPASVSRFSADAIADLTELIRQGFIVPCNISETSLATKVLARERQSVFNAIILPHEDCNCRCVYCYETFARGRMKPLVAAGVERLIARKAADYPLVTVSWFGGEPLLAKDIIFSLSESFIAACARTGATYRSGITTNAVQLTPTVFARLLAARVDFFQITLDGDRADHDSRRKLRGGQGTFDRILTNLRGMLDTEATFSIRLRVNFDRPNLAGMNRMFERLSETVGDDSRVTLDFHPVGQWGGPNDSTLEICDAESAFDTKLSLVNEAVSRGFSADQIRDAFQPHGSVCYAGKESSVVIGSDGTLYKCTVAFEDDRNRVGQLLASGDMIIDDAKWDLWTNPGNFADGKCSSCSYAASCQSRACPLAAMNSGEPPCPLEPDEFTDLLVLAARRHNEAQPEHAA